MKYLFLLFMTFSLLGCSSKTFVPTKNMQEITSTSSSLTLKVNQEAYYKASVHGSVGTSVEVHIDNETVINVADIKVDYTNPERADMPGGDSATKTFVLKALTAGEAKITVKNLFRGELKSEQVINCVVSKE